MLAEKTQIPVKEEVKQARQSTVPEGDRSNLWAQLRRLKAQIGQIELLVSTIKRDVARIDRKQYREVKEELPAGDQPSPSQYPEGLFN